MGVYRNAVGPKNCDFGGENDEDEPLDFAVSCVFTCLYQPKSSPRGLNAKCH